MTGNKVGKTIMADFQVYSSKLKISGIFNSYYISHLAEITKKGQQTEQLQNGCKATITGSCI